MSDHNQSSLNHAMTILMTDNTLVEQCFWDLSASNVPTRSEPPSPHPSPNACSQSAPYDSSPPARSFNNTVDADYHNDSLSGSILLSRAQDSILKNPTEVMTHRRYEGPGLNEPDFHVVVQGTSHTPACSVLPPMLPSLALPSFFGSTYGSQEILSEVEIAEVSSSPPSVVTLDSASSPPSSSPLQVFSSSPLASSQASEPHDDPEPEKFFFSPSKIQPESIQKETYCVTCHDSTQCSGNATNHFDTRSSSSNAPCLPGAFLTTGNPPAKEVLIKPVSNDDSEAFSSPLSTPNPGYFDHVALLAPSGSDTLVESHPLALLSPQSSHPAAQPLEPELLQDAHTLKTSQHMVAAELSLSISSPAVIPHSSPMPRSFLSSQLSSSTVPMEIELAEIPQEHMSVPATGFAEKYDEENSVPEACLVMGKRKRGLEDVDTDSVQNRDTRVSLGAAGKIIDPSPKQEVKKPDLPNPKRLTNASQKQQHRKLAAPFRSPVLKRPRQEPNIPGSPPERGRSPVRGTQNRPAGILNQKPDSTVAQNEIVGEKKRHRTQRAAAQFKSPLSIDASLNVIPLVRLTPTIQAQERKLQILKRAVKVQRDGDEETLETLLKKWTEAGREVAWEVWHLVKDNGSRDDSGSKVKPSKKSIEDEWGWNETPSTEKERNWGWDVVPDTRTDNETDPSNYAGSVECEDEEEKRQDTLGTMLVQLGIAPETLGWNEDEENFEAE